MKKATARILKAGNVKLEGQFCLSADHPNVKPASPNEKSVNLGQPQVCIVEKTPQFSIVEITCSCGTKTCVKCEYAQVESSAETSPVQDSEPKGPEETPDQAK